MLLIARLVNSVAVWLFLSLTRARSTADLTPTQAHPWLLGHCAGYLLICLFFWFFPDFLALLSALFLVRAAQILIFLAVRCSSFKLVGLWVVFGKFITHSLTFAPILLISALIARLPSSAIMKIFHFTVITRCFFGNCLNAAKVCFRLLKVLVDV